MMGIRAIDRISTAARIGLRVGGLALAAALLLPLTPAGAQQVVAFVYGEPITALDIDQRARIIEAFSRKRPARKDVLEELIDQKIKLHQARRLDIDVETAAVNREYANMARRGGRSVADLDQAFQQAGINPSAFKTKLRADLAWREVMQKMSPGSFQVRDADVVAALLARGQTTNSKAMQYTMRQVVFVVPRSSPDSARAARVKEAESLRAKFSDCERDLALAREYREVVVKDPVIRISTDLPQRLRELLEKTPDGRMTPPEPTAAGIEVVAVCGRKETVADLSSRTEIREELLSKRVDSQEKKILDDLRRRAVIDYR
ncbi:MAG TPA: SurA N-terminal domain-containing protein [Xanthobacteraceae bacterium]|nr:SurA N-terminal domain-containing protein [Xanthobacteraceae bacterium]